MENILRVCFQNAYSEARMVFNPHSYNSSIELLTSEELKWAMVDFQNDPMGEIDRIWQILDKLQKEKGALIKENASLLSLLVSECSLRRLYR